MVIKIWGGLSVEKHAESTSDVPEFELHCGQLGVFMHKNSVYS